MCANQNSLSLADDGNLLDPSALIVASTSRVPEEEVSFDLLLLSIGAVIFDLDLCRRFVFVASNLDLSHADAACYLCCIVLPRYALAQSCPCA